MSVPKIAALVYAALAIAFVAAWELDPQIPEEGALDNVILTGLLVVHPIAGFLIPRLWALALPYVALFASLPFSEPDPDLYGLTDAGAMFLGGFIAMILVAFGIACRVTLDAFREPR